MIDLNQMSGFNNYWSNNPNSQT